MDFAALQVFKAVVDEGGISPAARKLHRVQSNVSTRIQQLEASLGTPLFVREKRRLFLSPAGELFLGYVDQLLKISEQARSAVRGDAPRGVLRIGTLESTAASRLPPLLSRYHQRYPAVRVELATGTTDSLVEAVLGRKLEAAFVAECDSAAQVESIPVFLEELVVVAPRSHARIRRAQDVRTDTMIAFPSGCAYRRRLQAWLAGGGIAPSRVLELSSYHAIIACVASGTGIALAPRSVLETIRGARDVSVYRLATSQRKVTTSFVWRRGEASSPLRAFRDQLADFRKARNFRVAASLA
ncbi:MAG: LysR family transcriptional regulator [Betaproteobacteria bacterium]|nr:MAG: LysR family transcriptional regulator [Betaproteobacteria bacterium]TMH57513.1 MAG: LysR family transcriptional regulator [Betaproteobacteria bacterium]